jgi:protein-S-isoprenylcysteine O-methyltransferase Ste14
MHGDQVVAAGPYLNMRNPLYLGTFLHTVAGVADAAKWRAVHDHRNWLVRALMLAEKSFLGAKLGTRIGLRSGAEDTSFTACAG